VQKDQFDPEAPVATIWRDGKPVYDRGEAVAVIGAGASGLTAIKNLREHGFEVDCYERETSVGGAWNWRHDRSPVYASTHLISSKPMTEFPDFPMPDDWPDYPDHTRLLGYFGRYADHFGLRDQVWFGVEVARIEPAADGDEGRWDVTVRGAHGGAERTMRYAAVVVANGHNWNPRTPEIEGLGEFRGKVVHASAYKDPTLLRGRKVLVVGAGNTGCDIAVEAAQQAARCWHSTRRGYWYAPKYTFGRPTDQVTDLVAALRLPLWFRQWLFHRTLRLTVGDLRRFGLPAPDHKVLQSHPIVNSQLVYHLGHGSITPVPDVARFHRDEAVFVDGSTATPDVVVLATGYRPAFEFVDGRHLGVDEDGRPHLYLHAFAPGHQTLFVAGMVQPDSGVFPLVHWQTVAIARWLRLRRTEPARAAAFWPRLTAQVDRRWTKAKVTDSPRHWFEVSHTLYLRALQRTIQDLEATS